MIRGTQLSFAQFKDDIKGWWKARDEYQYGIQRRGEFKGKHQKNKRIMYITYQSNDSVYFKAGFQDEECNRNKELAYDFETMTEQESSNGI